MQHHHHQQQHSTSVSPSSITPSFPTLSLNLNENSITQAQFKEQLQLHVQTIGILVAEKAELQSKLQQQTKKSDKKQEDCDELMGRLKASRQKISDLEKLIQQLSQNGQLAEQLNNDSNNNMNSSELERLKAELNSNYLLIDELKMRLNESNENYNQKQQETVRLAQLTLELKSQIEIMQLKITQLNNNNNNNASDSSNAPINNSANEEELAKLKELNSDLGKKLNETTKLVENQQETLKKEYQTYVDQLQRQVESLVDQINRMTDEREDAFAKIDRLEAGLKNSNSLNQKLTNDLDELSKKLAEQQSNSLASSMNTPQANKIDLLENEVKYFKQQIELLLVEDSNMRRLLQDKEQSIVNINKLLEKYESDREQFNRLLEQTHSDKQTISRILTQNNDLKKQLNELQDVYVSVTQQNLDLATQLQAEQFKLKQLSENPSQSDALKVDSNFLNAASLNANGKSHSNEELNSEWGDDNESNGSNSEDKSKKSTLMNSIRVCILFCYF